MFPKTRVWPITMSTVFPNNAFTAGTDVTVATKTTKRKVVLALKEWGNSGITRIPTTGNTKAKRNNKDSVMGFDKVIVIEMKRPSGHAAESQSLFLYPVHSY
jgi:hypothetical protein